MKNDLAKLLTVEDVCNILQIKPSSLYNWIYLGKIKAIKISRRMVRFREEDVLALIEENIVT